MAGSHMYPSFISNYDEAEEWCNKVVNNGHDLLFDVDIFDVELEEACHKFKFPTEVNGKVKILTGPVLVV